MKTTTVDFRNLQSRHNLKPYKTIECYRRVWNGTTRVYHLETTALDLFPYLDRISSLNWALDTEGVNKWRMSNVTLTLKNTDKEFNEDNSEGLFYNCSLWGTKIKIKCGYIKDDGTYDTLYVFNGVIEKEPNYDYDNKKVILNISGLEVFAESADAEEISVEVTDEVIGTGASATAQVFTLANNGVGKIKNVKIAGIEQFENVDFKVQDLNVYNRPAQINMIPDAPSGLTVTCSYRYWYQDKTIQWLIGLLLNEAGFDSNNTEITNAIFYSGERRNVWNTKAEFDLSVKSRNIDTTTHSGDIEQLTEDFNDLVLDGLGISGGKIVKPIWDVTYDCNDLPESATPAWTKTLPAGYDAFTTREIASSIFHMQKPAGAGISYISQGEKCQINTSVSTVSYKFKMTANDYTQVATPTYFDIQFANGSYKTEAITVIMADSGQASSIQGFQQDITAYTEVWIYINNATGKYSLYINGVLKTANGGCSVSADEYVYFSFFGSEGVGMPGVHWTFDNYLDYFYYDSVGFAPGSVAGTATSTVLDFGTLPIDYGNIFKQETLNGGTILYQTQTSGTVDFTLDNDSWRDVSWNGNVGTLHASTVKKRYLRWRTTITPVDEISPEISEVTMPASILFNFIDLTTDLYSYGAYDVWNTLNLQQIKFYSLASSDAVTFDTEVLISGTTVSSAVKRYMKFRNIISKIASGSNAVIHRNRFLWNIKSFNVQMADFSDMSVQKAIENLAFLVNYEIGITAEGKHFFRSKTADNVIDWAFDTNTDIEKIISVKPLWEKVYNKITFEYGDYVENSDALLEAEYKPNSEEKFGKKFLKLGGTGLFIDPDINIAKGMVETYYAEYKNKGEKKEVVLDTKLIFQLDLGDTVTINSDDLAGKTFKVVGLDINVEDWKMGVTVWEN